MPTTICVDGSQQYGTPTITTTTGAVAYKLNNLAINRPISEALDHTATGQPQRQRFTAEVATLTAEAQLATSSTVLPIFGDTFSLTVDVAYGSELWIITEVDVARSNEAGAITVVPIKCKKALNGAPTLVT